MANDDEHHRGRGGVHLGACRLAVVCLDTLHVRIYK